MVDGPRSLKSARFVLTAQVHCGRLQDVVEQPDTLKSNVKQLWTSLQLMFKTSLLREAD